MSYAAMSAWVGGKSGPGARAGAGLRTHGSVLGARLSTGRVCLRCATVDWRVYAVARPPARLSCSSLSEMMGRVVST
eukprot:2219674-Pyramimonas_sp.AAC.1